MKNFRKTKGGTFRKISFLDTLRFSLVIFEFLWIFENFKKVENRCWGKRFGEVGQILFFENENFSQNETCTFREISFWDTFRTPIGNF